jgi:hypothetical protein
VWCSTDSSGSMLKVFLGIWYVASCIVLMAFIFAVIEDNLLATKALARETNAPMPLGEMIKFAQAEIMQGVRFYPKSLPLMRLLEDTDNAASRKNTEVDWLTDKKEEEKEANTSKNADEANRKMRFELKARLKDEKRLVQLKRTKAIVMALKDNAYGERKRLGAKLVDERRRMLTAGPRAKKPEEKRSNLSRMMSKAANTAAVMADNFKDALVGDSDDEMTREESIISRQKLADDCTAMLRRDGLDEMVYLMVRCLPKRESERERERESCGFGTLPNHTSAVSVHSAWQ